MGSLDHVEQLVLEVRKVFKDPKVHKACEVPLGPLDHRGFNVQKEIRETPERKVQKAQQERLVLRVLKELLEPQDLKDRRGLQVPVCGHLSH